MLIDYVRNTVQRIIDEKERAGKAPLCCTLNDIMPELIEDVTECMRELHRAGEYLGSKTVNKIPMLLKK